MSRIVAVREPIWWGAVGLIAVLSSIHATIAFATIYLAQGAEAWPPEETPLPAVWLPTTVIAVALVGLVAGILAHRQAARGEPGRLQVGAGIVAALIAGSAVLSLADLLALDYDHTVNAFASAYWVNVGLHLVVAVAVVGSLLMLALRHWSAAEQVRLRNAYVATILLSYYVTAGWVSVYGVLHLVPRLWVEGGA